MPNAKVFLSAHDCGYLNIILNGGYTWRGPSCPLRFLALRPSSNIPTQDHLAIRGLDRNLPSIHLCGSFQRLLDLVLYIARGNAWVYGNQVRYTLHTLQVAYYVFRRHLLEVVFHAPLKSDPAVFDKDLDAVGRHGRIPIQDVDRRLGDIRVGVLTISGELDDEFVCNRPYSLDTLSYTLSRPLLSQTLYCSIEY